MFRAGVLAALTLTQPIAAQSVGDELDGSRLDVPAYAAWRTHIAASRAELRWQTIAWRQTFAAGLVAAHEQGKPLLFYAMNGHPLGCT